MGKRYNDDEFKKMLEEQFIKEAEEMEAAIFADKDFEDYEATPEEIHASYEKLVARLKADGVYREETETKDTDECTAGPAVTAKEEKIMPMPVKNANVDSGKEKNESEKGKAKKWDWVTKAAVMLVFFGITALGTNLTSEANRKYIINQMRILTGNDTRQVIGNDDTNEDVNISEYQAIKAIEETLNVEVPEIYYRPDKFEYDSHSIDGQTGVARMKFKYKENIITLLVDKQSENSASKFASFHGDIIGTINLKTENILIEIEKVQHDNDKEPSYYAQWERNEVVYCLFGKMKEKEFIKMIEKIIF